MQIRIIVLFLACLSSHQLVAGQTRQHPRFEFGGSGGLFGAIAGGGDGFFAVTLGPRLTFNATANDGFEIVADTTHPVEGSGLYGLYLVQYKRVLGPTDRRSKTFITAGFGGSFEYDRDPEFRWQRPDGSIYVFPARTQASIGPPLLGAVGIGLERQLRRYFATRAEVQLHVFRFGSIGVKGSVGVSLPIGGHYD